MLGSWYPGLAERGGLPTGHAGLDRELQAECVALVEAEELLFRQGYEPFAMIPSSLAPRLPRWLQYYVFSILEPGGRWTSLPVSVRFQNLARLFYTLTAWRRIPNRFVTSYDSRRCILVLLSYALSCGSLPDAGAALRFLARLIRRGRTIKHTSLVFQQFPNATPAGGLEVCGECPDATIRNGRLVPVCMADYLDPLPAPAREAPMKVTFINPNFTRRTSRDAMEPLAFAVLAGLTPPSVKRVLYDERVERLPLDEPTDLVAISAQTFTAKRAYSISAEYRKRGIPVVLGGYHPTLQADEASRYADSVAVGDAEETWPSIVEDAAAGRLKSRYEAPMRSGNTTFHAVYDRSIFHGKPYPILKPVQFSRGCRFACDFCSVHAFHGSGARHRDLAEVIDEIRGLRSRYLFFVDDNLFTDRSLLEQLLAALKPLRKVFACQVSIDAARDDALPRRLAEAGCQGGVHRVRILRRGKPRGNEQEGQSFGGIPRGGEPVQEPPDHGHGILRVRV